MLKKGDRVRVRIELAEGYVQPYRGWIASGRGAPVVSPALPDGSVKVQFDTRRRPKRVGDYEASFSAAALESIGEEGAMMAGAATPSGFRLTQGRADVLRVLVRQEREGDGTFLAGQDIGRRAAPDGVRLKGEWATPILRDLLNEGLVEVRGKSATHAKLWGITSKGRDVVETGEAACGVAGAE